jgi:hypothetical protein
MKRLRLIGIAIAGILALLWIGTGLQRYAAEPIAVVYALASGLADALPQIYVWGGIVAFFLVVGLRWIPIHPPASETLPEPAPKFHSSLGGWLKLIQDRRRGAYFHWRLANRLAELQRWIGIESGPEDEQIARYLRLGNDSRTIGFANQLSSLNINLESIVSYLEANADAH